MFYFETAAGIEHVQVALEQWRTYLLGDSPAGEPYSQDLLSIESPRWERWGRSLGGFAMPNLHLTCSTVGPFLILGISKPDEFRDEDKSILAPAMLNPAGGNIQLSDTTTDAALGVRQVKIAVNYWQSVGLAKLSQLSGNEG